MAIFGIAEFAGIFPLSKFCVIFSGLRSQDSSKKISSFCGAPHYHILFHVFFGFGQYYSNNFAGDDSICFKYIWVNSANQYLLYIYLAVESFPQHIQSTSFGIVEVLGQISKAIAPLQISVSRELGISPIVAIGIVGTFFMLIPLFFVRETL